MARGVYSVNFRAQAITTAITILEVTAPSTAVIEVIRAWANQKGTVTDSMDEIQLLRKTATITGTATPPSAVPLDASAASGATIKWKATGEGTDGNILYDDTFHIKNGWLWTPGQVIERIIVPPSGIIALKFPAAPAGTTWNAGIVWDEAG